MGAMKQGVKGGAAQTAKETMKLGGKQATKTYAQHFGKEFLFLADDLTLSLVSHQGIQVLGTTVLDSCETMLTSGIEKCLSGVMKHGANKAAFEFVKASKKEIIMNSTKFYPKGIVVAGLKVAAKNRNESTNE